MSFILDTKPLSAFGDMRVVELSPQVQCSFEYTVTNTEIGTITNAGSGAASQANAMCVVNTGSTTASTSEWESSKHAKYRAGLGGLFRGTAMFTTGVACTEQMLGLADASGSSASHLNGYAVGYDGATFSFMRWQNDVLFSVPQSQWDDKMDGTGASGMTLLPQNLNVYFIQFQYLGAGAITLWIEDDSTGLPIKAHTVLYANLNTTPSVYNPNFHMMLHVENGATTADLTAKSASMAYFIEGRTKYQELQQPQFSSGKQTGSSITTEVALFTIRNKATYAGKVNYIDIILENLGASLEAGTANNLGQIRLVRDATLGGSPSYSDISATDSVVDIDTSGTTVTGGKELLFAGLAGRNDAVSLDLTNYDIILAPGETLTVAALSANSSTLNAAILWKELF